MSPHLFYNTTTSRSEVLSAKIEGFSLLPKEKIFTADDNSVSIE